MSSRSRGRDVSIPSGTLHSPTTRLMGVSPLGVPFSAPTPIANAIITLPLPNSLTVQPAPTNRVATNAPRNDNLYRPAPKPEINKVCADRHIRREVIFASGKGGRKTRRPKFTPNSKVKC